MRRVSVIVLSTILALAVWSGILVAGAVEGWWRQPLAPSGHTRAFMDAAIAEIDQNHRGTVAFVLIERGEVFDEHVTSVGQAVDRDTLGGGYTLLQLIVEEVSGQSFNDSMRSAVFVPLGMTRSTYSVDGAGDSLSLHFARRDLALYFGRRLDPLHSGARENGEWRTRGPRGPRPEDARRDAPPARLAAGGRHLGPRTMLYAGNNAGGFVIGHDRNNDPAINTAARVDPETGNGVVVLETGNRVLATTLAGEWLFWRTGNVDFLMLTIEAGNLLKVLGAGWMAIVLIAVIIGWRSRRAAVV